MGRNSTKPRDASRRASGAPLCVDLFSGAGGLAEGFRQAGWQVAAGVDSDPFAAATFRMNFPEAAFYEEPVRQSIADRLLGDLGLKRGELGCLVGGPPCQSFSYNNHHRSAADERARLFDSYLRIVSRIRPRHLVMENVPGILTIANGAVIQSVSRRLARMGYSCAVRILFAEDFGVPQARRRVFVVGSRLADAEELVPVGTHGPAAKPLPESNPFVHHWELPPRKRIAPAVKVWEAIGDLPRISNGGGAHEAEYSQPARTRHQAALRGRSRKLRNHVSHSLSGVLLERIETVPEGGNWRDIPRPLLTEGMKRARPSDHTKRYGRLHRNRLASTILTKCDPHWGAYIHPTQNRTISVREAARLQGFPDSFRFAGEYLTKQYVQVGNAVPPPVARRIAAAILSQE